MSDNPFARYASSNPKAPAPVFGPAPAPAKPPSSYEVEQDDIKHSRDSRKDNIDYTMDLRKQFEGAPPIKSYRAAIPEYARGLSTAATPQGDLALTYAFAKVMDPDSVVRESEQGAIIESQPWFQSKVEQIRKQFGADGSGSFTPKARAALRAEMHNKIVELNRAYSGQRARYKADALEFGLNPDRVLGEHDGRMFYQKIDDYWKKHGRPSGKSKPAPSDIDALMKKYGG